MIDIHCHILPELDDGAANLETALDMARLAAADGITRLAATPHMKCWQADLCHSLPGRLEALQRELNLNGIPLRLTGGSEVGIGPELKEDPGDERSYTLNGSRYLLLELPVTDYPLYTDDLVFDLQLRGLTPIIAHPERNVAIQDDLHLMVRLAHRGVLGQLTGDSLLARADRRTRQAAEEMLQRGLVHVIASDGHDGVHRPPQLAAAAGRAAQLVGEARAQAMVTLVPAAILDDEPVGGLLPRVERRRWWQVGR